MKGLPSFFNTKQDYINCLKDYPEETKEALKTLLNTRLAYFDVAVLADPKTGINDDTHRVVEDMQQELREDPAARIFQLGFTVQEVEGLINA